MEIGIIGNGVVGKATGDAYAAAGHPVRRWDTNPERKTDDLHNVLKCPVVFLCLPTPSHKDGTGRCDTSVVDEGLGLVSDYVHQYKEQVGTLVLKSTVPVGYTRKAVAFFQLPTLCHSPEFLTARTAHSDARHPRVNLVGYPGGWDHWNQPWVLHPLVKLYSETFRGVRTIALSSDESEAVKLMLNSFFAAKVSIFNEFRQFSDKLGLDWLKVRDAMLQEGRVFPLHTQVPGPDGKRGFGGACLPKDLDSLIVQMVEGGYHPNTLMAAVRTNHGVRRTTHLDPAKGESWQKSVELGGEG